MAGPVKPHSGSSSLPTNTSGTSGVLNVPGTKFGLDSHGVGYGDSSRRGRISVNPLTGDVSYVKQVNCTIL